MYTEVQNYFNDDFYEWKQIVMKFCSFRSTNEKFSNDTMDQLYEFLSGDLLLRRCQGKNFKFIITKDKSGFA